MAAIVGVLARCVTMRRRSVVALASIAALLLRLIPAFVRVSAQGDSWTPLTSMPAIV